MIAATGADALAHAVESYVNRGSDPLLAALNIAAIRIIGGNLRTAVETREPAALEQLMLASTMAGIAFNMNANAIVHAASTPVTARHGVPHGVANGIFMPPGLAFLAPACARELREVAEALGEDVSGLSDEEAAERAVEHIRTLLKSIGIPATLREWGIDAGRVRHPPTRGGRDEEPEHRHQPAAGDAGRPRGALPGGARLKIRASRRTSSTRSSRRSTACGAAPGTSCAGRRPSSS